MRHRVGLGLGVLGVAGACVWLAINVSGYWILTAMLWFGAVAFTLLGFRTLLGKVAAESPDPPWPAPFDPVVNPLVLPGQPAPQAPGQRPSVMGPSPNLPPTVSGGACPVPDRRSKPASNAALTDAVVASGKRIVRGMVIVELVLSLIVLIPATLFTIVVSVDEFRDGLVVNGILASVVAAFLGRYTYKKIRDRKSLTVSIDE
jgi:hypothetical protein